MTFHTLLPIVGCAVLLAACASDGGSARPTAGITLDAMLAEANTASKAGQYDKAVTTLRSAASSFPAEKAPWLQIAQIKFDRASYGEAILNAQEALQRDPVNRVATSIVAVSGLRLSTKAITDLARQNNLNGDVRTEAREVARMLRASLNEDVLVPVAAAPAKKPAQTKPPRGAAAQEPRAKPAAQGGNADPFGALK